VPVHSDGPASASGSTLAEQPALALNPPHPPRVTLGPRVASRPVVTLGLNPWALHLLNPRLLPRTHPTPDVTPAQAGAHLEIPPPTARSPSPTHLAVVAPSRDGSRVKPGMTSRFESVRCENPKLSLPTGRHPARRASPYQPAVTLGLDPRALHRRSARLLLQCHHSFGVTPGAGRGPSRDISPRRQVAQPHPPCGCGAISGWIPGKARDDTAFEKWSVRKSIIEVIKLIHLIPLPFPHGIFLPSPCQSAVMTSGWAGTTAGEHGSPGSRMDADHQSDADVAERGRRPAATPVCPSRKGRLLDACVKNPGVMARPGLTPLTLRA